MTDVPWTGTGGISDTQSKSWIIQKWMFDKLAASSMFAAWPSKRMTQALPVEADLQLPHLGVFFMDEVMTSDGEFQTTTIGFDHVVTYGFQIVMKDNDPDLLTAKLDRAVFFIQNQLLRDDLFTNMHNTDLPDNIVMRGFPRARVSQRWGAPSAKGETAMGERQFTLAVAFKSEFFPTEFPDLERITIKTAFPPGATPEEQAAIEQVVVVYEFNPDSVELPLPPDPPP